MLKRIKENYKILNIISPHKITHLKHFWKVSNVLVEDQSARVKNKNFGYEFTYARSAAKQFSAELKRRLDNKNVYVCDCLLILVFVCMHTVYKFIVR